MPHIETITCRQGVEWLLTSEMAGLGSIRMSNFTRKCQSGYTISHSHQQSTKGLIDPLSFRYLILPHFFSQMSEDSISFALVTRFPDY